MEQNKLKSNILSDEEVANIIKQEMSLAALQSRTISSDYARISKSQKSHDSSIVPINKTFLKNTIQSTEAHNRREEIADCWREHEMLERSAKYSKRRRHDSRSQNTNEVRTFEEQENDRAYWAERKANKHYAVSGEAPSTHSEKGTGTTGKAETNSESSDSSTDSSVKNKRSSKKKTKKKKKHKKAKKHKKDKEE